MAAHSAEIEYLVDFGDVFAVLGLIELNLLVRVDLVGNAHDARKRFGGDDHEGNLLLLDLVDGVVEVIEGECAVALARLGPRLLQKGADRRVTATIHLRHDVALLGRALLPGGGRGPGLLLAEELEKTVLIFQGPLLGVLDVLVQIGVFQVILDEDRRFDLVRPRTLAGLDLGLGLLGFRLLAGQLVLVTLEFELLDRLLDLPYLELLGLGELLEARTALDVFCVLVHALYLIMGKIIKITLLILEISSLAAVLIRTISWSSFSMVRCRCWRRMRWLP